MDWDRFRIAMNPEDTANRTKTQRHAVVHLRRGCPLCLPLPARRKKNRRMAACMEGGRRLGQLEHAVSAGLHGRDREKSHLVAVSFALDLVQVASHGIDLAR